MTSSRTGDSNERSKNLWVFGYGSLIWNPGFSYVRSSVGSIKGFKRRFWQGNDIHRGTPDKLGRVVTLIAEKEAITWGRAYLIKDECACRSYLDQRECQEGGYEAKMVEFVPRDNDELILSSSSQSLSASFQVLVYIALPTNRFFLGPAPEMTIACDIAFASGECGPNVEYLAKLVAFMRYHWPEVWDDHLYELERSVKKILDKRFPCKLKYFDNAMNDEAKCLLQTLERLKLLEFDFNWRTEKEIKSLESRLNFIELPRDLVASSKGVRINI
ncbi:glutathione-specific gamma-glutamylcyclotransferase 1 [Tetranychus urticae]|uniref:glutathione-specific gamma-glutamylcyclotransferase n=1 Tax=Tetranychus urticae TaxID=32264 RepID=T1JQ54_TETUR|nr:glutathione-specific gamma-glutamylcyclotransferase 1 [Tetranychus urticae]